MDARWLAPDGGSSQMNSFICDECREAGYSSVVGVTVPIVAVKKSAQSCIRAWRSSRRSEVMSSLSMRVVERCARDISAAIGETSPCSPAQFRKLNLNPAGGVGISSFLKRMESPEFLMYSPLFGGKIRLSPASVWPWRGSTPLWPGGEGVPGAG